MTYEKKYVYPQVSLAKPERSRGEGTAEARLRRVFFQRRKKETARSSLRHLEILLPSSSGEPSKGINSFRGCSGAGGWIDGRKEAKVREERQNEEDVDAPK